MINIVEMWEGGRFASPSPLPQVSVVIENSLGAYS